MSVTLIPVRWRCKHSGAMAIALSSVSLSLTLAIKREEKGRLCPDCLRAQAKDGPAA